MEWVETTGRTLEEAKERALDELGVDEVDAEFEVVAEPKAGLFGRIRSEARVRARVRPTAPRSKEDRRDRRRRLGASSATAATAATAAEATNGPGTGTSVATQQPRAQGDGGSSQSSKSPSRRRRTRNSQGGNGAGNVKAGEQDPTNSRLEEGAQVDVPLEEQGRVAEQFLNDLTGEFGLNAAVAVAKPDEDTLELQLSGKDLGLLIGPKGATLVALQNLTRTVVHHRTGANNGHINVDVGGYRHKRTEALIRFAEQVAATVKQKGERAAMEPMSAVDRKVVHDAIGRIDGVSTMSEGEEPRRRVVVVPSDAT